MSTFPLFNSFPPEIHSMIIASCPENDRVCLSLTCKRLYDLAPKARHVSLRNSDVVGPLCSQDSPKPPKSNQTPWGVKWAHRQKCHEESHAKISKQRQEAGLSALPLRKCRTRNWEEHCECFTRRKVLHSRLRKWMPKGTSYCGVCDAFTKRKRQHNERCYHGCPKPRRYEGNNWTHRPRRGAFGRKLWRQHFNNAAFASLEARLSRPSKRQEDGRYSFRIIEPKIVDTSVARDSYKERVTITMV